MVILSVLFEDQRDMELYSLGLDDGTLVDLDFLDEVTKKSLKPNTRAKVTGR